MNNTNRIIDVERSSSTRRGWFLLLALLLISILSVGIVFPWRVTPVDAAGNKFSGERAMIHLPIIASEPHRQGSPAQAKVRDYLVGQLTGMGLEVEIQQAYGAENVIARLPGSDPTGTIVILSHYDSVTGSPGAGDNGSGVTVLLEVMRALAEGPALSNTIIALFDDGEELPDAFTGSRAFVQESAWMSDVRVAISLDTAIAGPISLNESGPENGWLMVALARSYNGGAWTSLSGGGGYDSTPFRNAGVVVLAFESNYPFRQQHTSQDIPDIVQTASVQQMGDQTLAIARELGYLDLTDPRGEQETFFAVPILGLIHYPESWSLPIAIAAGALLVIAIGLNLWRGFISWRGLGIAFGMILVITIISVLGVSALQPKLSSIFGWETNLWPDWPEVIPPCGGLIVAVIDLLVLGLMVGVYLLVRRWSGRADFSLAGLVPFFIPALALSVAEPRAAYPFLWPVLIGSFGWIAAAIGGMKGKNWLPNLAVTLAAFPLAVLLLPFLPGVVMADGMKSINILVGFEALMLGVFLPMVDELLVRRSTTSR